MEIKAPSHDTFAKSTPAQTDLRVGNYNLLSHPRKSGIRPPKFARPILNIDLPRGWPQSVRLASQQEPAGHTRSTESLLRPRFSAHPANRSQTGARHSGVRLRLDRC